ncbi:lysophospholipid acyltransferase family protein [Anaeromyxobacter dehalogenans]|uniref:1-acyl-sn-glycerol-3-phosphate acyltransferase n=1 Tax=Anaeromyxobacter dehalogenans (strain 2CP-C) TaxID=290397 RepID=Q2II96_ANADE|nr:lysophospholipid acyltransferase family protein [Anaeromyxobacter dehalogenans]ABC81373.1 1-acyl-sn-glycerol-3-phosphate acyltransferase [Anaeromyxobacter dehalogenans 2CP-C]
MLARARGFVVLVYCAISMAFFFFVSLPVMLLTGSGDLPIWFARFAWSPSCLWLTGSRVHLEPLPPLPDGPLIFASNHESALDIWVLFKVLPRSVRFIAKAELFRLPVFGAYMRLGGHVPVDRSNHAQAVQSLRQAGEVVRAGTSLIVFPEGTRSLDCRVHPFKKGPFVVAMEAGVPVVPVAISGSGKVTPKRIIAIWPGPIRVAVGEPVSPADFPDRTALLTEVRRRVIALHRRIGGEGGDEAAAVATVGMEGV